MKEQQIPIQLNVIYFGLIAACTVMIMVIQLDLGKIASSSLTRFDRPLFDFDAISFSICNLIFSICTYF